MPRSSNTRTPLQKMDAQRRYAWVQYYDVVRSRHTLDATNYRTLNGLVEETLSEFVKTQIREMATALKKTWECPICLEFIPTETLDITPCGHYYCKGCLATLKTQPEAKCAMCRKVLKSSYSDSD
jgi:hypothetical protein